jgi:hypothetical protein
LFVAAILPMAPAHSLASDPAPVRLRYSFPLDKTNLYRFELDSQGESGREGLTGTISVVARKAGENQTTLTFRTQLRPKPMQGSPGMMMGYRPGGPPPLSFYLSQAPFNEGRELTIDDRGRVLRQAGDAALPLPLGTLVASLVQEVPAEPTSGWESNEPVYVLDEPMLQGPSRAFLSSGSYGYMPYAQGRGAQAVLRCQQTIKAILGEVAEATAAFSLGLELKSEIKTGTEPRVSATGEGKFVFDRSAGIPKQVEWQCKAVAVTDTLSRRSIYSLKWELIEGEALETFLKEAKSRQEAAEAVAKPGVLDAGEMLEKLKSEEMSTRYQAALQLANGRVTNMTPAILAEYVALTTNSDDQIRRGAVMVVANAATPAQLPFLLKAVADSDQSIRSAALKAIGRLKDAKAAPALVELVATGGSDSFMRTGRMNDVSEALVQIGTPAEKAVLPLLKEKNVGTLIEACGILKQFGTKDSLSPLKELTLHRQKELSEAAAEACRTIQGRIESNR